MDAIMKSQFLSLYCMVLADGIIDARELETLYRIGTEQYGLTQEEITATVRDAGTSFIMPTELSDKIRFLYNMAQIAYADGEIDNTEIDLMKRYIRKMNFCRRKYQCYSRLHVRLSKRRKKYQQHFNAHHSIINHYGYF